VNVSSALNQHHHHHHHHHHQVLTMTKAGGALQPLNVITKTKKTGERKRRLKFTIAATSGT